MLDLQYCLYFYIYLSLPRNRGQEEPLSIFTKLIYAFSNHTWFCIYVKKTAMYNTYILASNQSMLPLNDGNYVL